MIQIFLSSDYEITPTSDRMGYRLNGSPLTHRGNPDIISDGMVLGAIQIPPNGQPILMMSDHATTGGLSKNCNRRERRHSRCGATIICRGAGLRPYNSNKQLSKQRKNGIER